MSNIFAISSAALIPLTSLISLSIYLAVHPSSSVRRLLKPHPIALPTQRDEALDESCENVEEDPLDLEDSVVCDDGTPIEPDRFWASMRKRKVALLCSLSLPFTCNIVLLVFAVLSDSRGQERTTAILVPSLLIPSHLITILLSFWYFRHNDTPSHWSTTIHLSVSIFIQFFVLAIRSLLPSTALPWSPPSAPSLLLANFTRRDIITLPAATPLNIVRSLLPILHFPPLLIILCIRRGPPLHFPLKAIYPVKITNAIPADADALDPLKANVTQETQATIPEWLLFGYATDVIRKGHESDGTDVWDLPVLQASARESSLTLCVAVADCLQGP